MRYFKQTFGNMENIYAVVYGAHKNGNLKAVIISDIRRKAIKTSIRNQDVWTSINIENVPVNLLDRAFSAINQV